jgi:hypothetical protein
VLCRGTVLLQAPARAARVGSRGGQTRLRGKLQNGRTRIGSTRSTGLGHCS